MRSMLVMPAVVAMMLAAPAIAQTTATSKTTTTTPTAQLRKIGDMPVVGANGQKIGKVEDVLIDPAGKVAALIVDVGGFLGIAKKEVMVDVAQVAHDGTGRLVSPLTEEQIKSLPEWKK
jgi:sporulation protein YlmC with PRC-barrel domain